MPLSKIGDVFAIGGGGRARTFVVEDKIIYLWQEVEQTGFIYGERMFFSILDKTGSVLQEKTSLGGHLTFEDYPNGFGQNVYHVSADGPFGLLFHVSEFANGGFVGDTVVPYQEHRLTIKMNGKGALGDPVEVGTGYMKYEVSDTANLSNGTSALLYMDVLTRTTKLEILDAAGVRLSLTAMTGTFDNVGIFSQGVDGLEVLQVGNKIMTLYRNPATDKVYGQLFKLDGTEAGGGEFIVSQGDHGDSSFAAVWLDGGIDAEVLTDGRVAVVWSDSTDGSDSTEVWLTLLNADGTVANSQSMANVNHTAGEQYHARVHALDSGGFVVTFDQNFAPATDPRAYAQLFDSDGKPVGDLLELGAGVVGNGGAGYGHIFADGTGFMIDWYGNVQEISASGGGSSGSDPIEGTKGRDVLAGTKKADVIDGKAGNDTLKGLGGGDDLIGGGGKDKLLGGGGADTLQGDGGNDRVLGGGGNDHLFGGAGSDRLDGQKGNDVLTGGGGADVFVFGNRGGKDTITDFQNNKDTILLDDALWGGGLSVNKLINTFAKVVDGDAVFDFGKFELTLEGVANLNQLRDDIEIA
nr:calcium-binding protein [Amylibacter sp.]